MVRCVTFEIRWHDTLPIYSCAFQPISSARLAQVLDHNLGQGMYRGIGASDLAAAGLPPGHSLAGSDSANTTQDAVQQAPVLAGGQSWRLATAGGDNNVRIWMIHPNIPSPAALAASSTGAMHPPRTEYAATLTRHTGVVNVVRFSPQGDVLASAGDDGNVLFWVRSDQLRQAFGENHFTSAEGEAQYDKESWRVRLMTRATPQELYDMAWSPDGEHVAVGGTDFAVRIINTADGSVIREISEHQHYVQGVAWDPLQRYLATQSSDRSVHVYNLEQDNGKAMDTQLVSRHSRTSMHGAKPHETKAQFAVPAEPGSCPSSPSRKRHRSSSPAPLPTIRPPPSVHERLAASSTAPGDHVHKLYGDDRSSSFFRRLAFSPDGGLLATPTGQYLAYAPGANEPHKSPVASSNAVYLYGRANFGKSHTPIAVLPGHKSTTLVVSFSPILYRLRDTSAESASAMPAGTAVPLSTEVQDIPLSPKTPAVSTFGLPYRMVYAVATQDSVWIYDTQQAGPLCCFSNLHYAAFTDLAWSPDGQSLMMSSSDGYCSIAVFDYHELGRPYQYSEQPALHRAWNRPVDATTSSSIPTPASQPPATELPTPATPAATDATATAETAPLTSSAPSQSEPKKKRRVALKFEGPLPPS